MRRTLPMLLPAAIALLGCGSRDAVEDPAPSVPAAAAIPSAAPGARGAQFNAPLSARPTGRDGKGEGPLHPFEPPDDPYGEQEPPEGQKPPIPDAPDKGLHPQDAHGGRPAARPPKQKGVSL